jgi:hypothetical protein
MPDDDAAPIEPAAVASDALAHFWKAAHELLQAARVVIDAADAVVDEQLRPRPETPPRVRRIDVDEP